MRNRVQRALGVRAGGRAENRRTLIAWCCARSAACCVLALGAVAGCLLACSAPALAAAAPAIGEESVTDVASSSVTFQAQIDPEGTATTYRFEYGPSSSYGTSIPVAGGDAGAGSSVVLVEAHPQELSADTLYHYRVVASSAGGTVDGPDETFTTQSSGGEFVLPDGRQYELVSPPQKDGAEILGIGGAGETAAGGDATQVSEDGKSITYITNAPVDTNSPGNTWSTQLLSTRSAEGWSSQDIAIPHENAVEIHQGIEEGEEYLRFSSNLSSAVVQSPHSTLESPLAPEISQEVAGDNEVYLRDDITGAFQALLTAEPLPEDVAFEGATPDLGHVVLGTLAAGLDPSYPSGGGLYEWSEGRLRLVNVLPSGKPTSGDGYLGGVVVSGEIGRGTAVSERHAISNDGSRIVWSGEGALFTRDMTTGETIEVDAAQGGGGPSGGGKFLTASSDGSRVFFTDANELTSGAHEGGLFMFDVADGKLTDLAPGATDAQVQSFFGASEDGTSLYTASAAVLTSVANGYEETAKAGASNLYLLREAPVGSGSWGVTFITTGAEEGADTGTASDAPLVTATARIAPSGGYLAFMSQQSLTGYDNDDAISGQPDEEVYLYDAATNRLVCASCDPTGARPVGVYDTGEFPGTPMDPWKMWTSHWLAATIPGWTPDGADDSTGYQPRFLSDSGRLFFDSADALVPQDVNGKVDVYEYEQEGVGSCQAPGYGQSASDVFSGAAGGCIGLISAGTGSGDSSFFDASANGDDVFFTTQDGLVPQDHDGTSDMYDARVCTSAEPCPSYVISPPPCTTADSCRAAPSPQPAVFGAPSSATFAGAGNVAPTTSSTKTVKPKAKTKTASQKRAEKLTKALKACRPKKKLERKSCVARAYKHYGKAKTSGRRTK
jgi:hypothetical protein